MLATMLVAALFAPGEIAITWSAPAGCPDASYLRARIGEHLRGVAVEATLVHAQVLAPASEGARWHLQLAIGDEGRRELDADSCEALADAAAVMVAISLNASIDDEPIIPEPPAGADDVPTPVLGSDGEPAEAGTDEADAIDVVPSPPASPPSPPVARRAPWASPRALLGVAAGLHAAGLPVVNAQLGARVGVRWGPLSMAVTGTHWFRRERAVIGDVAASYQLSAGGLDLCGHLPLGRGLAAFELSLCAVAEAGRLRAQGRGASPSRIQRHPWVGLGGGAAGAWVLRSWLALGVRADIVAPLLGRRFVVGDVSAGAVGPIAARATLVVEVRVPKIVGSR